MIRTWSSVVVIGEGISMRICLLEAVAFSILVGAACADDVPRTPGKVETGDRIESPSDGVAPVEPIAPCESSAEAWDRTICPPERVGPLLFASDRSEIGKLFGENRLVDDSVDIGEGMFAPGTIVNKGQDDEITVVWTDESRIRMVALQDLGRAWRTPEGVGVGSTLSEVEGALGSVQVLGFGWDYEGTILLDGTPLENRGLFLRTEPRDASSRTTAAWARVRGDRPFRSTDPDVRALDLVVRRVDIRLQ
jgi:hypothetical protein